MWTLYRHSLQAPPHIHFTVVRPPHEVPVGLYLALYLYLKQIAMFSYCYVEVFAKTASVRLMSAINMLKQGFTFTPNMRFNIASIMLSNVVKEMSASELKKKDLSGYMTSSPLETHNSTI